MSSIQAAMQAIVKSCTSWTNPTTKQVGSVSPSEWTMRVNQAIGIFGFANGLQEREYHISFTLQSWLRLVCKTKNLYHNLLDSLIIQFKLVCTINLMASPTQAAERRAHTSGQRASASTVNPKGTKYGDRASGEGSRTWMQWPRRLPPARSTIQASWRCASQWCFAM
jgi:hypothetical protein